MADRTYMRLEVKGVAPQIQETVGDVIKQWVDFEFATDRWVEGGATFSEYEISVGTLTEIARVLDQLIDESQLPFAYAIWEDPKYEYDGDCIYNVPDVGRINQGCNADGQVHVTASALHDLIDVCRKMAWDLPAQIETLTGRKVLDAWENYSPS